LLPDVRALHLHHHHRPAVSQRCAVDLAQRSCGHRLSIETRKRLGNPDAQLGHHDFLHLGVGEWLHLVLQSRKRLQICIGQQVWAARQNLSQLDVGRSHRLQIIRQLLGQGVSGSRRRGLARVNTKAILRGHLLRQIRAPVLPQ